MGLLTWKEKDAEQSGVFFTEKETLCCIHVDFVPAGTSSHSECFLRAGKSPEVHRAILLASQVVALTTADLISNRNFRDQLRAEFETQLKI